MKVNILENEAVNELGSSEVTPDNMVTDVTANFDDFDMPINLSHTNNCDTGASSSCGCGNCDGGASSC